MFKKAQALKGLLTICEYTRLSPATPTALTGSRAANACDIPLYSPAETISSMKMESACRTILSWASVTSPSTRIASPGPGKGWRPTRRLDLKT